MKKVLSLIFLAGIGVSFSVVAMERRRALLTSEHSESDSESDSDHKEREHKIRGLFFLGTSMLSFGAASDLFQRVADRVADHALCTAADFGNPSHPVFALFDDATSMYLQTGGLLCAILGLGTLQLGTAAIVAGSGLDCNNCCCGDPCPQCCSDCWQCVNDCADSFCCPWTHPHRD